MKAVVNERYGSPDVLLTREVPTPEPKAGEVMVKVHATTVGRTDTCALRAHPFFMRPSTGMLRPKRNILGLDFAGTVEAVGPCVKRFSVGDRVFGLTLGGYGGHAEYVCVPEDAAICTMPAGWIRSKRPELWSLKLCRSQTSSAIFAFAMRLVSQFSGNCWQCITHGDDPYLANISAVV